jgi:hypothetical protein
MKPTGRVLRRCPPADLGGGVPLGGGLVRADGACDFSEVVPPVLEPVPQLLGEDRLVLALGMCAVDTS